MVSKYGIRSSEVDQIIKGKENKAFLRGVSVGVFLLAFIEGIVFVIAKKPW